MSLDPTAQEWNKYIEELYQWINELYKRMEAGELDPEEYQANYDYYIAEIERVEEIRSGNQIGNDVEVIRKTSTEEEHNGKVIRPEVIEEFFFSGKRTTQGDVKVSSNIREFQEPKKFTSRSPEYNRQRSNLVGTKKVREELSEILEKPKGEPEITPPKPLNYTFQKKRKKIPIENLRAKEAESSASRDMPPTRKNYVPIRPSALGAKTIERDVQKEARTPAPSIDLQSASSPRTKVEKRISKNVQEAVDSLIAPAPTSTITLSIVLLGNSGVGRTSIRRRFMGKNFIKQHLSTVGASMDERTIDVDGRPVRFILNDLGGQDFYQSVRISFYRKIAGAIIVFDLSDRSSFIQIDKWILELFHNTETKGVPFILVGNKSDLKRKVKEIEGQKLAENLSAQTLSRGYKIPYIEVSAKNNEGIEDIFKILARSIFGAK